MSIILNGTTGITTPDITSSGSLNIDASAPDNSLVVTSAGNVGVGTGSPTTKLDVNGPAGVTSFTGATKLGVVTKGSTGVADYSGIDFIGGNLTTPVARIAAITTGGGSKLSFGTSNSYGSGITNTAVTIDSSGNLLVGTTSTIGSARFVVAADSGTTNPMAVHNTKSTASTDYSVLFYRNSALVGSIQTSLSATSFITSSDYRLKEDWVAVANASTRVNALKPINFAWKVDGSRVDGFLAHELADVVPEAVTGAKDATEMVDIKDEEGNVTGQEERPVYQGIDQSKLVPLLTAALQEALAAIETLTARVSALEAK